MVTAFVLITTRAGKEDDVVDTLESMEGVKEVKVVYGDFDIIVKLGAKNMDELNNLVLSKLRSISGVSVTSTLVST